MDSDRTKEIKDFLHKLNKEFSPELVILFGSRARDEYLTHSDFDFIVVSKKFKGVHFLERIYRLLELWQYDTDVDFLPYTPEEFQKKKEQIGIVSQAIKEGIKI
jgi:predicted nucleotidyltransferase